MVEWSLLCMTLKYFAHLREITRISEENYSPHAPTLRALLDDLCRRYGSAFRGWLLTPEGELSQIAIVLVNGNDVRHTGMLETPLSPSDTVCMFPPVAGGSID
mgnify:CR=1 FL=1